MKAQLKICLIAWISINLIPFLSHANDPIPCLRIPIDVQTKSVDPTFAYYEATIELTEQLFLGLLGFNYKNAQLKVIPEIASHWEVNQDATVYRFVLREDIFWVKGISGEKVRQVTAKDIVWAIQRNINPETDAPYAFILYVLKNGQDIHTGKIKDISAIGARVINDFCIEFELENPATFFPSLLTLWIFKPLPQELIHKFGEEWVNPENIWTNGPYFMDQWQKYWRMNFKKNPHYYQIDQVRIPELHYYIVPESFAGLHMYKENKLDILGDGFLRLPASELFNISNDSQLESQFFKVPRYFTYCYLLNTKRPPLDNPSFRKAISLCIDRFLLVDIITHGKEIPSQTFTPPFLIGLDPIIRDKTAFGIQFDPDEARKLLKQLGYSQLKNIPEINLLHPVSELHTSLAKAFASFLKHYLNIKVNIEAERWEKFSEIAFQSDRKTAPHITPLGWGADYLDAHNWLNDAFSYSQGFTAWEDEQYKKLIFLAGKSQNIDQRNQLYQKAETILVQKQCAIVPIYFETAKYLIKPRVKNWYFLPTYGQQLKDWSLEMRHE